MREELSRAGLKEARTATDVDQALAESSTTMVVVNSICGCAAGKMRPGVRLAMQHTAKPDHAVTVFAGQDREATERAPQLFWRSSSHLAGHRHPAATGSLFTSCSALRSRVPPPRQSHRNSPEPSTPIARRRPPKAFPASTAAYTTRRLSSTG